MSRLNDIMEFNQGFVKNKEYTSYATSGLPDKKLVIVACMDTRLTELLPKAMNLANGDAKFLKTAGAVVAHPFGSVMRSIMVAVYELGAEEVCVVGHHRCGMSNLHPEQLVEKMIERGISKETISTLETAGIHLNHWLRGFDSVQDSVRSSVQVIRNHPLLPKSVAVHGLVIDPDTGELEAVEAGY